MRNEDGKAGKNDRKEQGSLRFKFPGLPLFSTFSEHQLQQTVRVLPRYWKVAGFPTAIGRLQVSQKAQLSFRFSSSGGSGMGDYSKRGPSLDTTTSETTIASNWLVRFQSCEIHRKLLATAAKFVGLPQLLALSARELPASRSSSSTHRSPAIRSNLHELCFPRAYCTKWEVAVCDAGCSS
jgi:hypothetical protein